MNLPLRVLLLEGVHPSAEAYLRDQGVADVTRIDRALDGDELRAALAGVDLLGIRSRTRIDAATLDAAPDLLALGCFCIGTSQVDLHHAASMGLPVFNAPHSNTRSVAELVIAFVVFLIRDAYRKSIAAHAGRWLKTTGTAHEVRGKTLGIVGYGHIGTQVSVLAESMGMTVLYHDIETRLPLGNARPVQTLDELLARADIVTLHVPETPLTRNLIDAARIAQMKPGGLLVNTSRGTVVDLEALAEALREGRLAGAAVDVFPKEPAGYDAAFESPLRGLPNVILTPHIAGATLEAQENIGVEVARKLAACADHGNTSGAVNFPQLALAPVTATPCRILHVHRNVPGVVRKINDLVADENLNIAGQHLMTLGEVGYVALDVEGTVSPNLLEAIRRVPGTVRARVVCP